MLIGNQIDGNLYTLLVKKQNDRTAVEKYLTVAQKHSVSRTSSSTAGLITERTDETFRFMHTF